MMLVIFTETAAEELAEILDYIAQRNASAARSVALEIDRLIEHLRMFPLGAQQTDRPDVRRATLGRYPYLFYTVEADAMIIRNVRHDARRYP
jgi:plasmid stabilization system protein ParE